MSVKCLKGMLTKISGELGVFERSESGSASREDLDMIDEISAIFTSEFIHKLLQQISKFFLVLRPFTRDFS